jgi:hypothetical protein
MNALKRIELFAVWRYGLKKRNGYNNSSGIIAHHIHLFCHVVTLCGLTQDFLHTSNYNRESAHIYWDKRKLCRWTVRKWGPLLQHTPKWRYQVTTFSLLAQFVLQSSWAAVVLYGCACRFFHAVLVTYVQLCDSNPEVSCSEAPAIYHQFCQFFLITLFLTV